MSLCELNMQILLCYAFEGSMYFQKMSCFRIMFVSVCEYLCYNRVCFVVHLAKVAWYKLGSNIK